MKAHDAIKNGFYYTGMSESIYRPDKWEATKERAQAIKKKIKGADFRVVQEKDYKSIYGNSVFRKYQFYKEDQVNKYLTEDHDQRLEELRREYEEAVRLEIESYNRVKADHDEYLSRIK